MTVGIVVLRRFVTALGQSEALVEGLERRIVEKRAELEASYARVREIERRRILSDERQRIMRDVQDGVGSRLASTLAMAAREDEDRGAIGDAVRSALDDLRLMIDALAPADGEILPVLGQLRARLQRRLDAAGIRVDWRVADVARVPDLGPERVLRILRLLNQAITDLARDAECRTITVSTGDATAAGGHAGVFVEVSGDGLADGDREVDMRARGSAIGTIFEAEHCPTGTWYRLWLPLANGVPR
jgi:signal transduction histidine kinase